MRCKSVRVLRGGIKWVTVDMQPFEIGELIGLARKANNTAMLKILIRLQAEVEQKFDE